MEQEKETGLTVEEICQMMKTFDQSSLQSFLLQQGIPYRNALQYILLLQHLPQPRFLWNLF